MCSLVKVMTGVVRETAALHLPPASLSTNQLCITIGKTRHTVHRLSDSIPLHTAHSCTLPAHAFFVRDFTILLTALVLQLDRFGSRLSYVAGCSIGTPEERLFWELWGLLVAACSAFAVMSSIWPDCWLVDQQLLYSKLITAFHATLAWLLSVSRSPAWTLMRTEHGSLARNSELITILTQPVMGLVLLQPVTDACLAHCLSILPPDVLPLICCIISEQFGTAPLLVKQQPFAASMSATSYTQSTHSFTPVHVSLHLLLCSLLEANQIVCVYAQKSNCSKTLYVATSPAIVQMMKVILLLPPKVVCLEPGLVIPSLTTLVSLFVTLQSDFDRTLACLSSSTVYSTLNTDSCGLPKHSNPLLSRQVLDTDMRLLHVLGGISIRCREAFPLQSMIVRGWNQLWTEKAQHDPVQSKGLEMMMRGRVGVAKECSSHMLCLMKQLLQQRVDHVKLQVGKSRGTTRKQQQKQYLHQRGNTVGSNMADDFGADLHQLLHGLMQTKSRFLKSDAGERKCITGASFGLTRATFACYL